MTDFLARFKLIIREANYDNTYKMAWAKALVEISTAKEQYLEYEVINLKDIAARYVKYYWDQTIFFDLIQGSNISKPPLIVQYVKELIEDFYVAIGKRKPQLFIRTSLDFERLGLQENYNIVIERIAKTLKQDVSWRFLFINGHSESSLYQYNKGDDRLFIKGENLKFLHENYEDLFELINYRWSLILETFNSSPRINKKVRIMDEREIKRASLNRFHKYLDLENPQHICFSCGNPIAQKDISIDHVIPWSYMYSDDIWNLVYVHRECNSLKTDIVPNEIQIINLKERNEHLLEMLENNFEQDKITDELKMAVEKDLVTQFWIGCKQ